jgi:hypothetical protein
MKGNFAVVLCVEFRRGHFLFVSCLKCDSAPLERWGLILFFKMSNARGTTSLSIFCHRTALQLTVTVKTRDVEFQSCVFVTRECRDGY